MAGHNVYLHGLPVDTDEDRGKFLLTAHSEILNNGAAKVEEALRDVLASGAWRSYTYTDGTHHEWLEREFDYFVSAWLASTDGEQWESVRRNIVSRDVIVAMADHSGGNIAAGERRELDEVRRQFPAIAIEPITVVSKRERSVALNPERRKEYLADQDKTPFALVARSQRWVVHHNGDDLATAIVAKLEQDPKLAKAVYNRLQYVQRKDRNGR